jgi:hypothetical protein
MRKLQFAGKEVCREVNSSSTEWEVYYGRSSEEVILEVDVGILSWTKRQTFV